MTNYSYGVGTNGQLPAVDSKWFSSEADAVAEADRLVAADVDQISTASVWKQEIGDQPVGTKPTAEIIYTAGG